MKPIKALGYLFLASALSTVAINHHVAIAQSIKQSTEQSTEQTPEQTLILCETASTAIRVYKKGENVLMRGFDRNQNVIFMNDTPTDLREIPSATAYRNTIGELNITVLARKALERCSIAINNQPAEEGRLLADNRLTDNRDIANREPETLPIAPPTEEEPTIQPVPESALPSHIEQAVQAALTDDVGVVEFAINDYSAETWSDGCLGLGRPDEGCLAALTEGWRVEALDKTTGQTYIYRTNENGTAVRLESEVE